MTTTAPLTTGWEPGLADSDSICLRWLRHWSEQVAVFVDAAGGRVHRDERLLLADRGQPFSYFNAAVLLRPPADEAAFHAIVDEIEERLSKELGAKPVRREGDREARWILLDYIDIVVHVQHSEERVFYALERLWKDCPEIELPADARATRGKGEEHAKLQAEEDAAEFGELR